MKPKQKNIYEEMFAQAACKVFNCEPEEIMIEMIVEGKEAICDHKDDSYKVITKDALHEYIQHQIIDRDDVLHLFDFCWINATKGRINIDHLVEALASKIQNLDEAQKLLVAVVLSTGTPNPEKVFWNILWRVDKAGDLMGTTMITAAGICDTDELVKHLLELRIKHGIDVYNMHQNGIFKAVDISTGTKSYPPFYIYSSDR